MWMMPKIK
jgi:hypothetical protein